MPYHVYLLQSEQDDSFYIGYTRDLEKRMYEHNSGLSRYTKNKLPWKLIYTESYSTKTAAIKRERFLRTE